MVDVIVIVGVVVVVVDDDGEVEGDPFPLGAGDIDGEDVGIADEVGADVDKMEEDVDEDPEVDVGNESKFAVSKATNEAGLAVTVGEESLGPVLNTT